MFSSCHIYLKISSANNWTLPQVWAAPMSVLPITARKHKICPHSRMPPPAGKCCQASSSVSELCQAAPECSDCVEAAPEGWVEGAGGAPGQEEEWGAVEGGGKANYSSSWKVEG